MAGSEEDSWKSVLEKSGFDLLVVKRGLGEQDAFAVLFVEHAGDAARDKGIVLE